MSFVKFIITFAIFYYNIISNCESKLLVIMNDTDMEPEVQKSRVKRHLTGLTSVEQEEAVTIHNYFRALEGASNMRYLTFNQYLADMAQDWADTCVFDHGQPVRDTSTMPYNLVGQNLLITNRRNSSSINITWAVEKWYIEKDYYDFSTRGCKTHEICGHYTQVVWDSSREMGCGMRMCDVITELYNTNTYVNHINLVCNYGPTGNIKDVDPYEVGAPCTKCETGDLCYQNLCREGCNVTGCSCKAACQNGGSVTSDCKCACAPGWQGVDCTEVCQDSTKKCGTNWPKYTCNHAKFGAEITRRCPKMCGTCEEAVPTTTPEATTTIKTTTTETTTEPTTTVEPTTEPTTMETTTVEPTTEPTTMETTTVEPTTEPTTMETTTVEPTTEPTTMETTTVEPITDGDSDTDVDDQSYGDTIHKQNLIYASILLSCVATILYI